MAKEYRKSFKPVAPQLREKALHRVALGETPTAVARSIGVSPSTVTRWMKNANVEKGSALKPEANPMIVQDDHVMDAFTQELRNQNTDAALKMFLDMQDGVEDKYRVLMAQQLYDVFHKVMQAPPQIRTWSDMEKAHKIMDQILNPNRGGGRGGSTKLQIQLDVVRGKPTVIDADEVDKATRPKDKPDPEEDGDE